MRQRLSKGRFPLPEFQIEESISEEETKGKINDEI